MAGETIGRVQFLASLDGKSLPREAKELGRKIGAAGEEAGEDYGDGFQSGFDRKLSEFGRELSEGLERDGKRAGESFGDSLDSTLQSRFRRMQANLADILTDEDAFSGFARGFDNIGGAIDRANADLDELARSTYTFRDEEGKLQEALVLTSEEYERARTQIQELGDATQKQSDRDTKLAETQRGLARETEELNAQWTRLVRLVGDNESFGQAAERMGGVESAHRKLRLEIEQGGEALGRTRAEIDGYIDRLDLTRDRAIRVRDAVVEVDREHRTFGETMRGLSAVISKPWQNLDNDVRLVVGLIAAAADQIAALGSASGAGLISVGASISSIGVGLSGVIPVFLALNREIEDLPIGMRAVATEFQGLKDGFRETAAVISGSAFERLPGTFTSLEASLRVLDPAFSKLGSTVGELGADFAKGLAPGTKGLSELNTFIDDSTGLFDSLARSAGVLGGALIRSFNGALPLTEDFVGWIDKLIDRFDSFSRSTEFDSWVRNAQLVWGDFGELLDATGEALGDLANPSAVANLRQFMDDLTDFMPKLATGLNVLGELNVLGLVAQALNDIGTALEPLGDPLYQLAGALSEVASIAIGELAEALGVVAGVITPVVQGAANLLDALPPWAIEAIADAVIGLGTAFLLLKGAAAIGGALTSMTAFSTAGAAVTASASSMTAGLKGLAGKAGMFGLVAAGALIGADAILEWGRAINGVDDTSRNAVAGAKSLSEAFTDLSTSQAYLMDIPKITNWSTALDSLNDGWGRFFGVAGTAGSEAQRLAEVLNNLDTPIAQLAQTNLPAAIDQFSAWATEVGATDEQVLKMLGEMPQLKTELENAAVASGQMATDQQLVAIALGETNIGASEAANGILTLGESSNLTAVQIAILSDDLAAFAERNLGARDAARDYEAAIDSLTDSVAENGTTLDITTAQGRANEAAVDALAEATLTLSEKTKAQTGDQEAANGVIQAGRDQLIGMLDQFGITGQAAEDYADSLGLIPPDATTVIKANGLQEAYETTGNLKYRLEQINGSTYSYSLRGTYIQVGNREVTPYAAGTITRGPHVGLVGEAGPEAIVPLNRPLHMVDPSVRALAAFAQGKMGSYAGGGVAGGKTEVNIHAGAIVVQGSDDPRATALEVVDAIAELVNS